jgi:hypothetical protein
MIKDSPTPSNRNFGLLFAGLFLLFSAYATHSNAEAYKVYVSILSAAVVGLIAVYWPNLLNPFNIAWIKLGNLMGKVVSPLVLGVIFFVLITPTGLICRAFGRDELRLKKANVSSYFIDRLPPGPAGDSFKNQF